MAGVAGAEAQEVEIEVGDVDELEVGAVIVSRRARRLGRSTGSWGGRPWETSSCAGERGRAAGRGWGRDRRGWTSRR